MSLKLVDIKKGYADFNIDLSFTVDKGNLLTLLGPSGCGKTTTLHIIAGFIRPDKGKIIVNGCNINDFPPHMRNVGLVFQDYALFPNMNVFDNIAFGLRMHKWSRKAIKKRVHDLLKIIHLPNYDKRIIQSLSGGEMQRIALSRALAPNPSILLLDEPLSALDAGLRKNLRSEIKRIQRKMKITTVYVTHDQEEALALSDSIVVMEDGKAEQIGTPYEIYNRPKTAFVSNFVGATNMIFSNVYESDGNYTKIESALGNFIVRFPKILEKGMKTILIFRPEKCKIKSKKNELNTISGVVKNLEYLGDSTHIKIVSNCYEFALKLSDNISFNIGDKINIGFSPEDCWLLLKNPS